MSNGPFYQGGCGCGAVTLMTSGAPLGAASCDCADCRGAEDGAAKLLFWPETAVQFASGLDALQRECATHGGDRYRCRCCAEWVLTAHEEAGIMALPAEGLPEMTDPSREGTSWLVRLGHRRR